MTALQVLFVLQSSLAMPFGLWIAYCLGAKKYRTFWLSVGIYLCNDIIYSLVFLHLFGR